MSLLILISWLISFIISYLIYYILIFKPKKFILLTLSLSTAHLSLSLHVFSLYLLHVSFTSTVRSLVAKKKKPQMVQIQSIAWICTIYCIHKNIKQAIDCRMIDNSNKQTIMYPLIVGLTCKKVTNHQGISWSTMVGRCCQ